MCWKNQLAKQNFCRALCCCMINNLSHNYAYANITQLRLSARRSYWLVLLQKKIVHIKSYKDFTHLRVAVRYEWMIDLSKIPEFLLCSDDRRSLVFLLR